MINTSVIPRKSSVIDVQPTLVMESNERTLIEIATEFNFRQREIEKAETHLLLERLQQGQLLIAAQNLMQPELFMAWAEDSLKVKSSTIYNYIKIANNPELVTWSVQSIGLIAPTHLIEMAKLPSEAQEQVKQRFDAGEKVPVSEIKKYKDVAVKAEKEAAAARKDADEWRVSMQVQQQINQQNLDLIDKKADEKLQEKIAAIEEKAVSQAAADYQSTIDSLNDTISSQRTRLATIERTGERQAIEEKIAAAQAELQNITVKNNQANFEKKLCGIAESINGTVACHRTAFIAAGTTTLELSDTTYNALMDAHDGMEKLNRMLFDIANPATLTIEE